MSYLGGVVALTPAEVRLANGYSNLFWGWVRIRKNKLMMVKIQTALLCHLFQGGEDDDFYNRLVAKNMTVIREPTDIGR